VENKKIKISYWCPFIEHVATVTSTLNSIYSLNKYSKNVTDVHLINIFGEWNNYLKEISEKKITLFNIDKENKFLLNKKLSGFFFSRFKYFFAFFKSYEKLKKYLLNQKPDFLIIHLLTFIPLILFLFNNFETKLILRISGKPKLNFFRKILWRMAINKIFCITCPTQETYNELLNNYFLEKKLTILRDPVLCIQDLLNKKKNCMSIKDKNFCLAVGRLTKQKNFSFLINNFQYFLKIDPRLHLIILGSGEQKDKLENLISKRKLISRIKIIDFTENIYSYYTNCKFFIQCSLWEDPGFALIEAAYFSKLAFASDCPSGPKEIINHEKSGILFKNNDENDFRLKILNFYQLFNDSNKKEKAILLLKKQIKNFTLLSHFLKLKKILNIV
jgi:glycosyltransferase involved in cell wall biosynthesis